ncbi:MAG: glycosyltransferase [Paraburkholderia sp.]|uniref:glycosyltransferase n=1 Tax=Paraburkholderia sp. TaxID=1926495 RepID=UPI0012081416|nr:glycosyltransferase [Paraburkholderia sp.]TAM06458.1 MAG: glycosyltransferase [Paraburkholderia sp.]
MRIVIDMQGAQTASRFRGIGRYTLSLAQAIVRNRGDHEIVLALNGLFSETIEPIRTAFHGLLLQENIQVWSAPGPTAEAISANHDRRKVAERIREAFLVSLRPDVILVSSLFEGFGDDAVTSIGVFDREIPVAVILYDLIPLINPDIHFKSNKAYQDYYVGKITSLKRARRLLAISESAQGEAVQVLGFDKRHVTNISGACDAKFRVLNLTDAEKNQLRAKYGIAKPYVMYTGGADGTKNLHRLIEAFAGMPDRIRKAHQLVFVGKMPDGSIADLIRHAQKSGLSSGDLVITGYVDDDDLIRLYNACALFVFPSLHEGFGIPPLEAMRCGAPVIGSNATSLPEVIGRPDALFDPISIESIRDKMSDGLANKAFRANLVTHGHTHARTFSWDDSAKRALYALRDFERHTRPKESAHAFLEKTAIFGRRKERILLLKLDHMGDFVLAIPAITKLKAKYPYADIDVVIGSWNKAIASGLKLFRNIYELDFFKKKSSAEPSTSHAAVDDLLKQLGDYDIAIDLRRQRESRFILSGVRAGLRVGYQTFDEAIDAKLDIVLPVYPDMPHEKTPLNGTSISVQMLRLIDALPEDVNDFVFLPELAKRSATDRLAIAIFPVAGNDAREWGASNYVKLVGRLVRDSRIHAINIYFGNAVEAENFTFGNEGKVHIHCGLDFQALTQSVAENSVCVSNNSFGAHLGSYLGLVTVAIYSGHETVDEWGPVFYDGYVIHTNPLCAPCHLGARSDCKYGIPCLNNISVDFVFGKVVDAVRATQTKANGEAVSLISETKSQEEIVGKLMASIVPVLKKATRDNSDTTVAAAIARNHPAEGRVPQLLVDISELVRIDARSGIQRVVRGVLAELLGNPPKGFKVEPVYATTDQPGYRYARQFTSRFCGSSGADSDEPVDAFNGDIYIGLDLQPIVVSAQEDYLLDWHRRGIKIHFVVYDLLPVLLPHAFPDGASPAHRRWLEIVSRFDGVACISRAVADEFQEWLQAFGEDRGRPFELNWFHLGADIANTAPTRGLPDNAHQVLAGMDERPSFLMVGTLEPRKGHGQVIECFEKLWKDNIDVNLVVVGKTGWMTKPLAERIRSDRNYGKRLFWLEAISDEFLQKIYAASSCLIAASEGEGFGLPLIEAAKHKVPIIARDIPVFHEVAGEYAHFFPNDLSGEALSSAIKEWLALYRIGTHPRSEAMPWLTWKASTAQLFDSITNGKPYKEWLPDGIYRFWGNDSRLHSQVGERHGQCVRTTGRGGCLLFGPYAALPAGRYRITWRGTVSSLTGREFLDIAHDQGRRQVFMARADAFHTGKLIYSGEFVLEANADDLEFRLYVADGTRMTIDGVELAPLVESHGDAMSALSEVSADDYAAKEVSGAR